MISQKFQGAVVGALLMMSGHAGAHEDETVSVKRDGAEFQVKAGGSYVPIDCDLLDKDQLTLPFLRSLGIWGHLDTLEARLRHVGADDERVMQELKDHLAGHYFPEARLQKIADHCAEHFSHSP